jgi:hypothetical protein
MGGKSAGERGQMTGREITDDKQEGRHREDRRQEDG